MIFIIASENTLSISFSMVLKSFLYEKIEYVTFTDILEDDNSIELIEKKGDLVITLIMDKTEKKQMDQIQSRMNHMPPFIHCCLDSNLSLLNGEMFHAPFDLSRLLQQISNRQPTQNQFSKNLIIIHNRDELLNAINTFKHDFENKIAPFKSYVGINPTEEIIKEAVGIFLNPNNTIERLKQDYNKCEKKFAAFGLSLNNISPSIKEKIETVLRNINNSSKLSTLNYTDIPASMDELINILVNLKTILTNFS